MECDDLTRSRDLPEDFDDDEQDEDEDELTEKPDFTDK
jgi:hypothetical protein